MSRNRGAEAEQDEARRRDILLVIKPVKQRRSSQEHGVDVHVHAVAYNQQGQITIYPNIDV